MRRQAPVIPSSPPGQDDAGLVRRALARDEAAVRAIMQANNRRLYRIARGILRNEAEAEDVVQDTYVRAFTHLDQIFGGSEPGFDGGARRRIAGRDPLVPHRVHVGEILHVGDVDIG
ncbi:hypothetical protein ES703_98976 [subsurface metagenome]